MNAKAQAWPADKVERRAVSSLKPYAKNSRTHSEAQIEQIARSISEFGFTVPVLIDPKGEIIAGHGRVLAAASLGLPDVPVMVATGWTAAQKRAYVIADNKLALNAGWDEGILSEELKALGADGFDLSLTGFDNVELVSFLSGTEGETDPDDVPEPPVVPVSRLGDVWICGDHRVICGDSTDADTVATLLDGEKPALLVTDPPYGIGYSYDRHDDKDNGANARLVASVFALADCPKVWTPGPQNLGRDIARFGSSKVLVWSKKFAAAGNGLGGASTWEPILVVGKPPKRKLANDVIEVMTDREEVNGVSLRKLHTCPKPVALFQTLLEALSNPGDAVYEPFCGSGTTMIAAEMTGRKCYGLELSPAYVDVIVSRWEAFTGRKAVRLGDGITFPNIPATDATVPK